MTSPEDWAPDACTLPTAERPLRLAEFDGIFAAALQEQKRQDPTRLLWILEVAAEDQIRDLARREVGCCSFFVFDVVNDGERVKVSIDVPVERVDVLDALQARAAERMSA